MLSVAQRFVWCTVVFGATAGVRGELVITEFMAAGGEFLADVDGDYPDWVEIYNDGAEPVQLVGWTLTDDDDEPAKWTFPEVEIGAQQFLVVFASGKDRAGPGAELHTNFKLRGGGEYLGLFDPAGEVVSEFRPEYAEQVDYASYGVHMTTDTRQVVAEGATARALVPTDDSLEFEWTQREFNDGAWVEGPTGVGYDQKTTPTYSDLIQTDIGEAMRGINSSAFVRIPFEVTDLEACRTLLLHMRYEDAFVAYINGVEVARSFRVRGTDWDERSNGSRRDDDAVIAETYNASAAAAALVVGTNVLALHGANASKSNSDFFVLPELDCINVTGIQKTQFEYYIEPTPGLPNGAGAPAIAREPEVSVASGTFAESFEVTISAADPDAEIRYNLSTRDPDETSELYTGPILVDRTMVMRVSVFRDGYLRSPTVSRSYVLLGDDVLEFSSNLPLFVINTFGRNVSASGFTPGHVYVTDVAADGRARLTGEADYEGSGALKVRGSSTEGRPKKAYALELQNDRGEDLDASVLGLPEESDWILYGAYNFDRALIRNAFVYELSNQMGRYAVRTRFCEVFLNPGVGPVTYDHYIGVYSFMEKIKRGEHRVDVDKVEIFHNEEPEITGGYMFKIDRADPGDQGFSAGGYQVRWVDPKEEDVTREQQTWAQTYLNDMARSFSSANAADPELGYAKYIDVDSWIDHHIINEFTKNPDALRLSTYFFKPRGKVLEYGPVWDFDRCLGPDDDGRASNPVGWMGPHTDGWWSNLFRSPEFLDRYSERWLAFRADEMSEENLHAIIDSMADEIREAQERNFVRWRLSLGAGGWEGKIRHLKNWVSQRVVWMDTQLIRPPNISHRGGPVSAGFEVTLSAPGGDIYYTLDGEDPRTPEGVPSPTAILYTGPLSIDASVTIAARASLEGVGWSNARSAEFSVGTAPLVVTEIMYDPADDPDAEWRSRDFEFLEFQNVGGAPIDLSGLTLEGRPQFDFANAAFDELAPGAYMVLVKNRAAFVERYGEDGIAIAGEFEGTASLSDRGQTIEVRNANDEAVVLFEYFGEWYPETDDDGGYSMVIRNAGAPVETWGDSQSWRASFAVGGSPGREDLPGASAQIPGDINQDGALNLTDGIGVLRFLFQGAGDLPCATDAGNRALIDMNGDGDLNLTDGVHVLRHLFQGGEPHALGANCVDIAGCPAACGG